MTSASLLLADIGGTNARFALSAPESVQAYRDDSVREYAVADFPSLEHAARHFLAQAGAHAGAGVFAVAGRVDRDEARITNHPWVISAERARAALGLERLELINDFTAQAMAIRLYGAGDVSPIGAAGWSAVHSRQSGDYAVIGPGTGLGVGGLSMRDGHCRALQSEGGHAGFAPCTAEEARILEQLSVEFGRVSNERLLSGPGLVNIHRALSRMERADPEPLRPSDITAMAADGDPRCRRAIEVFCAVFGAVAGDLVLTLGAWDGVFLAGGLVPRLLPAFRGSGFRQRFEHKGRFSAAMANVPVLAVMHPHAGLLGAASYARHEA
ncbi:glucokinase [Lysobacter firmicutimachus]|uniref:Glucokinase n=1 Tax=Lysobacter firmicutimachus TaxID=1792846 RepID=A0AAU8MPD1_9GAMM